MKRPERVAAAGKFRAPQQAMKAGYRREVQEFYADRLGDSVKGWIALFCYPAPEITMNEVRYERIDGKNVLTLEKKLLQQN